MSRWHAWGWILITVLVSACIAVRFALWWLIGRHRAPSQVIWPSPPIWWVLEPYSRYLKRYDLYLKRFEHALDQWSKGTHS